MPGDMLAARYRIEEKLGSGAFGQVFAAEDTLEGRRVAIKLLRANAATRDPDASARLRQEAEILGAIEHPNIVGIHAVEDSPQGLFMVMELLVGRSIDQLLVAEGVATPARAAQAARQLLAALIASHAKGVLHRDLKPENIILVNSDDPASEQAKLLDFGVAKAEEILDDSDEDGITLVKTRGGGFLGTPRYCAPEIVVGDPADASADIFSLGLVLAEWLTGKERINARKQNQALAILLRPEPLDVSDCPENWQPWLAQMIAKAPAERYPTAEQALREFERLVLGEDKDLDDTVLMARPVLTPDLSAPATSTPVPPSEGLSTSALLGAAASYSGEDANEVVSETADTHVRDLPDFSEYKHFDAASDDLDGTSDGVIAADDAPAKTRPAAFARLLTVALGSCVLILLLVFIWQNFSG